MRMARPTRIDFPWGLVARAQPAYREAVDLPLRRLLRKVLSPVQHVAGTVRVKLRGYALMPLPKLSAMYRRAPLGLGLERKCH